ncbi:GNAT family N-acetyltransferase [Agarivorans sp. MS3-6]|uniref:GNAT family N-acetyltransferase n=1 Tax=Agarivorans sp. TSD2052 TaxID=2937286 RepID=UPI00200D04F9|nr:GNAT family N-acetyltransferase [Agarivorans sp. TSD2052]UPW18829.1 GNAT family N-acetyltransferase [Agarivorans sp. TSD2052]
MSFLIIPIEAVHDRAVCELIEQGGLEFGAVGEGFGPSDAEVKAMSQHYTLPGSAYWVAMLDQQVVGCGGIAPFDQASATCELRKLFVAPRHRGLGIGKAMTEHCLKAAKQMSYQQCYLDTLSTMKAAISLYQALGFDHLDKPFSGSIHQGCDVWMIKQLAP